MSEQEIEELIVKLFHGTLSPEEQEALNVWINEQVRKESVQVDASYAKNESEIRTKILFNILSEVQHKPTEVARMGRKITRIAAACVAVLLLGFFLYSTITSSRDDYPVATVLTATTISPASKSALLITPDGTSIPLNSEEDLVVEEDRMVYQRSKESVSDATELPGQMFVLKTPRGGYYSISLSDGTIVWLNADSRLEYPVRFVENERVVLLEGEAYFSVAKDSGRPFLVKTKNQTVRVYGTAFNINAYNENDIRTSLIEGKVSISAARSRNGEERMMYAGEKAVNNGKYIVVSKANLEPDIGWKNGLFYFNGTNASVALEELGRWYNLTVDIKGDLADVQFYGIIERNKPLHAILNVLKETGVRFEIEVSDTDKKLIVY